MAPQVIASDTGYGLDCDLWSVGVLLFVLLSGELPFWQQPPKLWSVISRAEFDTDSPNWNPVSVEAKFLVRALIVVKKYIIISP